MNRMKLFLTLTFSLALFLGASAQVTKEHAYQAMDNLIGGKWKVSGFFQDGNKFEQEYSVSKILNNSTYKVETYGQVSKRGSEVGLRNEGLRGWNKDKRQMQFVEADVFGGFIQGEIIIDGMDILYVYEYGGATMTDAWIYKGPDLYEYIVGVRDTNGQWTEVQINGGIHRQK